ncbi:embryonic polarity protein dorsal-like isoform X2 [Lycorma delicatula]|uniref:embryonic polarity protein dorsal-like isoform X2 n=1 Tax=Lycorma delicatula TaxID=130591 RepID=UPI003F514CCB
MDQKLKSEDGSSICHDINISDVIEVIETDDPSFKSDMMDTRISGVEDSPSLRILEQPAPKAVRFRYPCEGRSAGSIPGVNSTPENKSYPTVKIDNYIGRAKIVVSCVTKDQPYRPHPHMIAGRNASSKGVCVVDVDTRTMTAEFPYLGIQCVRRKDVEQMLQQKEENRIDPFGTGFAHRNVLGSLDLNTVRLCFQVFVEGPKEGIYQIPLCPPVVSDPIYDKKALSDLIIVGLSHNSASVAGGQQVILLCEKVSKDDIAVRLFEEKDNNIIWEACCDFNPTDVHKQYAITFRTPPYKTIDIVEPVEVFIQLQRPSDHETSEPRKFTLTPIDAATQRKRKKGSYSSDKQGMTVKSPINRKEDMINQLKQTNQYLSMQQNSAQMGDAQLLKYEINVFASPSTICSLPSTSKAVYGAGTSSYNPAIYSPPPAPVHSPIEHKQINIPEMYNTTLPIQQMNPALNNQSCVLQQPLTSPENIQLINNLNPRQVQIITSSKNILQPLNDLSVPSVQIDQMSPQLQILNTIQQQQQQSGDDLNIQSASVIGVQGQITDNSVTDLQPVTQLSLSEELDIIMNCLPDTETVLSENLSSSLRFNDIS